MQRTAWRLAPAAAGLLREARRPLTRLDGAGAWQLLPAGAGAHFPRGGHAAAAAGCAPCCRGFASLPHLADAEKDEASGDASHIRDFAIIAHGAAARRACAPRASHALNLAPRPSRAASRPRQDNADGQADA
jgi:hypothetical protein